MRSTYNHGLLQSRAWLRLIFCWLLGTYAATASLAADEPLPSAEELHRRFFASIPNPDSVHAVIASRLVKLTDAAKPPEILIRFHEFFLSGDSCQMRWDAHLQKTEQPQEIWWEGFTPSRVPLTQNTLLQHEGITVCIRPQGELVCATFYKTGPEYQGVYSVFRGVREANFCPDPYLSYGRQWTRKKDFSRWGSQLLQSLINSYRPDWKVAGIDTYRNTPTYVVTIQSQAAGFKLKKHPGEARYIENYKVWFSQGERCLPLKIEYHTSLAYNGQQIPVEWQGDPSPSLTCEFGPLRDFGNGFFYPEEGSDALHVGNKSPSPDELVTEYLQTGKIRLTPPNRIEYSTEWKVLQLEQIAPVKSLWIEPPLNVIYKDEAKNITRITGKSPEESRRLLQPKQPATRRPTR
ncbi:hypothetical protein [Planctomicrobium sp. SH664]|uniref:hypothetical protein n=1 Tax=Planctomicrobium sp. SH664 TaxID=3448125 RepID=UPI003F5CA877